MAVMRSVFEAPQSRGVIPNEDPTVNRADEASKTRLRADSPGSNIISNTTIRK